MAPADSLLRPGETCWRVAPAARLALIVDAADYFKAVKAAILRARHSILMISWEFDARIQLEPETAAGARPERLGQFITRAVGRRPGLRAYVLQWDYGLLATLARGSTPLVMLDWMGGRRVRYKLDRQHPPGSCHHQKIVVIDDSIAFCGGIDMTAGRWDTREHGDGDRRRNGPWGGERPPWHDSTSAVDGAAARALGDLARRRWERATGERLEPPPAGNDCWPDTLRPLLRDVRVAIARSEPAYDGQPEAREVEALYLAGIGSARRLIYLESQYFASRRITLALLERLREPEGPEIVVVNPKSAGGWLEEEAMGSARNRALAEIAREDRHRRFAIYYPVTAGGQPIYVHSKIMAIDRRLLRVGSSNLNNRSMGYDTECDLAIEALPGAADEARIGRAIADFRDDLLAEHLGRDAATVAAAVDAAGGSLIGAIEALRGPGRSLRPLDPPPNNALEQAMAERELLDPERPRSVWRHLSRRPAWRPPWRRRSA